MLSPKRVKFRKMFKGRTRGIAQRGSEISFGTYGLMARSIGQRTREIGIRRALGATDRGIVGLLLAQGGRQLGVGVAIALPVMLAVGVGFGKFFPIAIALSTGLALLVAGAIVSVVLFATHIPTRRVLAISPRDALWRD